MEMFFILAGVYILGCFFFMLFFLLGRWPALIEERSWPWPVIFLWPLLALWPVHFLMRHFRKWRMCQRPRDISFAAAISCVRKFDSDADIEPKPSAPPG